MDAATGRCKELMSKDKVDIKEITICFIIGEEETKKLIRDNFLEILEKAEEFEDRYIATLFTKDDEIRQMILKNFSTIISKTKISDTGYGLKRLEEIKHKKGENVETFDEEWLATLLFGKYGEEKCNSIAIIMKELKEKSETKIDVLDIKPIGEGMTSQAIQIGDYVLKLGTSRYKEKIRNNRRILQPIIRQYLLSEEKNNKLYIEVQNAVDNNWYKNMPEYKITFILYEIYADFRRKGQVWTDIKEKNVGRLLKANRTNYKYRDIDGEEKDIRPTEEATGIIGNVAEEDILVEGEYVVLDTDHIYEEGDVLWSRDIIWFEDRYQEEICQEEQIEEDIGKER